ncbi:MAG TPA: BamA/TamA family outer membrane protein [Gammaproteobacteria bacterium]
MPLAAAAQAGRTYVRRIEFEGVTSIQDEVLRREMLVLEGTYLDVVALEQSLRRLERLPYVDSARVALRPVSSAEPDLVDLVVTITEAPARRYGGGAGYAESLGVSVQGYFTHENLFGTGQRFSAEVDMSEHRQFASVSHTDPYARPDGVSRHVALTTRRIEQLAEDTSELDADISTARLEYGYRSGLWQHVTLGLELADTTLAPGALASDQLLAWIAANGDTRAGSPATQFTELDFLLRWRYDSRDRTLRPARGTEHALSLTAALPGSEVEYYLLDYELAHYRPIGERWTAALRAQLAFGAAYGGETSSLPPYLNRFAGGPGTVRGVRGAGLGPRDTLGNPYGGNLLTAAQVEVLTPWPGRAGERLRVGFFYDLGNVFETEGVAFTDTAGQRFDYSFDGSDFQHSAGIAAEVVIPLGIVRLSYGIPIERDTTPFGQVQEDRFQIAVGVDF